MQQRQQLHDNLGLDQHSRSLVRGTPAACASTPMEYAPKLEILSQSCKVIIIVIAPNRYCIQFDTPCPRKQLPNVVILLGYLI